MKKLSLFMTALVLSLSLVWPQSGRAAETLRLLYVEWDCASASSHLVKAVLEEKLGYKVELLPVSMSVMWLGLASGDADAMVTAWLPHTHAQMYKKVKDRVDILGKIAEGARLGLAVPDYVPLTSVAELAAHAKQFKKRIVGIDPGAGIMSLTEKLLKDYGIDNLELMEGSDTLMTTSLGEAIRNKEWIVVTAWSPHWMFGRWKLHYLDDPKKSMGEEDGIYAVGRKGLKNDHPVAWAFLSKFRYVNAAQLQQYMSWSREKGGSPEAAAKRFLQENPEQVEQWLSKS